jgi:C4-dicarboxylate-specific signal transduction histidine kinase
MPTNDPAARRPRPLTGRDCLLDTPEARVRLAATTAMASTWAQEVNQPLTAVSNYLSACARRLRGLGEGYEDVLAMLDHASRETLKAGEIIRRARNFVVSGRIAGQRENLRTMVERALLTLNGARREAVAIAVEVPLDLFVTVDRIQIEQLLANLLLNACEATAGQAEGRIVIDAAWIGDEIVLGIADSGPGLTPAVQARLFEPLFTTKEAGTGLGLAVAATIAEVHKGRIWAENIRAGGAIFRVALPAAA